MLATSPPRAPLADDLATALDPVRLLRRLVPEPDEWQARVVRSTARRMLLNIARQLGKSTTVAALAAHTARYEPGSLILCLSPGERQSAELHRKVKASLAVLGIQGADLEVDNILSTELANGSRLVALPGREDTIRGFSSARLLLVDEAARVRDDLYYAAAPMLEAGRGRLVALSTPKGRRGWWYQMWAGGGEEWERYERTAMDCPWKDPADLDLARRTWPADRFAEEFLCQFREAEGQVFAFDDIEAAFTDDVEPFYGAPEPARPSLVESTIW